MVKISKRSKTEVNANGPAKPIGTELPIEWIVPENMQTQAVANMLIQADEHDVFLSFFDTVPPPVNSVQEIKELAASGKKIRAKCVARIAIARSRFPTFANAISKVGIELATPFQITGNPESAE